MENFESRLACVINADGSIARGYKIEDCQLAGNEYVITWQEPLHGVAKTNFSAVVGSAEFETVEPGFCTVGLHEDPMKMRVHTFGVDGKPAPRPFHLAVFRD